MKMDIASLCDALERYYGDRLPYTSAAALVAVLRDAALRLDRMAHNVQGTPRAGQPRVPSQPIAKAHNTQGTRRAVAHNRAAERARAVVSVSGQGNRSKAEQRVIALFRQDYSERKALETLKSEGLKIDKSKLKALRAAARSTDQQGS